MTTAVAGASEGTASCSIFLPWVFSPCFEHFPFPSWVCGQQRQQHQQQQGAPELAASASTGCSRRLTSSTKSVSARREFRASVFGLVGFAVTLCRSSLPLLKRGTGLQGTGRLKDPAGAGAAVFGAVAKGLSSALERARGKRAQSLGPPGESVDAEEGGEEEVRRRYPAPTHSFRLFHGFGAPFCCNILQCCTVALSLVSIPPPPPPLEYPARDAFGHCFERDERALEGVHP